MHCSPLTNAVDMLLLFSSLNSFNKRRFITENVKRTLRRLFTKNGLDTYFREIMWKNIVWTIINRYLLFSIIKICMIAFVSSGNCWTVKRKTLIRLFTKNVLKLLITYLFINLLTSNNISVRRIANKRMWVYWYIRNNIDI